MAPAKGTGPRKTPLRRVNPLLPPKPKKAPTGYGLFLKAYWAHKFPSKPGNADYIEMNSPPAGVTFVDPQESTVDPLTGKKPRADFRVPAATWNSLTESQREAYKSNAEDAKAEYKARIDEWKEVKEELKRPASAFALFLKDTWARNGKSGRSFAQMSRYASSLWKILSESDKDYYKLQYQLEMKIYFHKTEFFRINGRFPAEEELILYFENEVRASAKVENYIDEDMSSAEENEEKDEEEDEAESEDVNESEDEGMSSDEENEAMEDLEEGDGESGNDSDDSDDE